MLYKSLISIVEEIFNDFAFGGFSIMHFHILHIVMALPKVHPIHLAIFPTTYVMYALILIAEEGWIRDLKNVDWKDEI